MHDDQVSDRWVENNEMVATNFLKVPNHHSICDTGCCLTQDFPPQGNSGLRTGHAYPPGQVHPQLESQMAEVDGAGGDRG